MRPDFCVVLRTDVLQVAARLQLRNSVAPVQVADETGPATPFSAKAPRAIAHATLIMQSNITAFLFLQNYPTKVNPAKQCVNYAK